MDSMYVYLHTAKRDQVIFTKESSLFKEKHIDTNAYTYTYMCRQNFHDDGQSEYARTDTKGDR